MDQEILIIVCFNLAGIIMSGIIQIYSMTLKKSFKSTCCAGKCCLLEKETQMKPNEQ
jgi:hypothetical protein